VGSEVEKIEYFRRFPREVAFGSRGKSRVLVKSQYEFDKYYHEKVPRTNFYMTVYSFSDVVENRFGRLCPDYQTALVNKIYFDFDDERCLENARRVHGWARELGVLNTVLFSGAGYHLFLFCRPSTQGAVRGFQHHLDSVLGLKTDSRHKGMFGDLSRVSRVPNTYNWKRGRWCVPISSDELYCSYSSHRELALRRRNTGLFIVGEKLLDLSSFASYESGYRTVPDVELPEGDANVVDLLEMEKLDPCIRGLLAEKSQGWVRRNGYVERRFLINYCKERLGLTMTQCVEFMRRNLTSDEFYHMLDEVGSMKYGQVEYLYRRGDVFLPNCSTLKNWGICRTPCSRRSF
jgi:hypothetical protein